MLNFRLAQPALLVDLNRVSEFDFLRRSENGGAQARVIRRGEGLVGLYPSFDENVCPWPQNGELSFKLGYER